MAEIRLLPTRAVIASQAVIARSIPQRLIGLLSRSSLSTGEAMVFSRCNAIHTWFMRFPIDVVFLKSGRIIKIVPQMKPFRMAAEWGADTVIELPAGMCEIAGVKAGELLEITKDTTLTNDPKIG